FIARYRKERTGQLDDVQLRAIDALATSLGKLDARRDTILASIREQGRLTPELERHIAAAEGLTELEDLYAPYRPKRRTRASKALDAGLEPVARAIERGQDP